MHTATLYHVSGVELCVTGWPPIWSRGSDRSVLVAEPASACVGKHSYHKGGKLPMKSFGRREEGQSLLPIRTQYFSPLPKAASDRKRVWRRPTDPRRAIFRQAVDMVHPSVFTTPRSFLSDLSERRTTNNISTLATLKQ